MIKQKRSKKLIIQPFKKKNFFSCFIKYETGDYNLGSSNRKRIGKVVTVEIYNYNVPFFISKKKKKNPLERFQFLLFQFFLNF